MLQQLPVLVAITLGRLYILAFNRQPALRIVQSRRSKVQSQRVGLWTLDLRLWTRIHHNAISRAVWEQHVIPLAVGKRAEDRLEAPRALVDEIQFIRLAV